MTTIQRLEYWGDRHHPKWMDIVRMLLGIFLIIKGIQFSNNSSQLEGITAEWASFNSMFELMLHHYIIGAHLLGGALLAFGLLTRAASLIQIPILIGAVFFTGLRQYMLSPFSQIIPALITLVLLIYFAIIGNGPWSIDAVTKEKDL